MRNAIQNCTALALKSTTDEKPVRSRLAEVANDATLEARCIVVIVANLENYPPEAMGMLSEDAWNSIIRMRHERTQPKKGKAGIDGKGRVHPAVSERFLSAVEEAIPHLSESTFADRLVWKDCVESRFTAASELARPRELRFPWPVLVQRIKDAGNDMMELMKKEEVKRGDIDAFNECVNVLCNSPMNVNLLEQTNIGKVLKKIIKAAAKQTPTMEALGMYTERRLSSGTITDKGGQMKVPLTQLDELLKRWKQMATESGVQVREVAGKNSPSQTKQSKKYLKVAESCQTWRALFSVLKNYDSTRKEKQGARIA